MLSKMNKKLFYIFLAACLINILVNGLLNLINLILLGILIGIISGKQKTGSYSLWKMIVGIGIAVCNILIKLGIVFNIVKL